MALRGLLIDFDGTLASSLDALRQLYFDFLQERGRAGSQEEFDALNGPPLRAVIATLKQRHQLPEDAETLLQEYARRAADAQAAVTPAPGADALLALAAARSWRVAIVTSSARATIVAWLERFALSGRVDAIIGGDSVARGKPDPEPYRQGLAALGLDAAQCLAIEDAPHGAQSARAAGIPTWGLSRAPRSPEWPGGVVFYDDLTAVAAALDAPGR